MDEERDLAEDDQSNLETDFEALEVAASGALNEETLSHIDEGVKNLKQAVINKLEAIFKRPDVDELNVKIEIQEGSGCSDYNKEEFNSLEEESNGNKCNDEARCSSLKDLAKFYVKERKSVLDIVRANTPKGFRKLTMQNQIRIWTEVATDLDTYYLTILNKNFRTGRLGAEDVKDRSVVTCRVSESAIDDIRKAKTRQRFYSRQDINDDMKFGQLQDYGQLQNSFGSSENSVHDIVDSLLAKTNAMRKRAIASSDREAKHHEHVADNEDCDEYWSDLTDSEASLRQSDSGKAIGHNGLLNGSLVEFVQVKEKEAEKNRNEVEKQRMYIAEQHNELNSRLEIINQLKTENIEIMKALDTFELYKLHCDQKSMHQIDEIRKSCNAELREKRSEIEKLKEEIGRRVKIKDEVKDALTEIANSRDFFSQLVLPVTESKQACFEKSLDVPENHGGEIQNFTKDGGDVDNVEEIIESATLVAPNQEDTASKEGIDDAFLTKLISKFSRAFSYCDHAEAELQMLNSEPAKEALEFLSNNLLKQLESTRKDNEVKSRQIELVQKGIEIQEFETMKKLFESNRNKLRKVSERKRESDSLLAAKDFEMKKQNEEIVECKAKVSDLSSMNRDLESQLKSALAELETAKENLKVAREELQKLNEADKERAIENEKLVKFILDNISVVKGTQKRQVPSYLVSYVQEECRCRSPRRYLQDM